MRKYLLSLIFLLFAVLSTPAQDKVLTILVNFQDKQEQPYTVSEIQNEFSEINSYYLENSYQQKSFIADVVGWKTIALSSTVCDQYTLASQAEQGIDVSGYQHRVYIFPSNGCFFSGTTDLTSHQIWINDDLNLSLTELGSTTAHELGHSLGLLHSQSRLSAYGDVFDLMGFSPLFAHFNAYQKERLGWITPSLITTSGIYHLDSYETTGQALKIFKEYNPMFGENIYFYVEKRTAVGFDSYLSSNSRLMNGVLIHIGSNVRPNYIYLEDMIPATTTMDDSPLASGESYTDSGVTISVVSADSTGANVQVVLPTPSPTPTPTPTPVPSPTPTPCRKLNPKGKCVK